MSKSLRLSSEDAIIEAAFAVFSRDPSASLSEVADRAGVGRATLHRYFSSREDLIRALAKTAIEEMDTAVEDACKDAASFSEVVRLSLIALVPLGDRYAFLEHEALEDDPELEAAFTEEKHETTKMVESAKQEGLFDEAIPTSWIVQAYDGLLYAGWESVRTGEATAVQAADLAWKTLIFGLGRTDT
ncbi:MAG: helix-turn-helix domain-containing protein [Pseudomonadota bacterium]